MNEINQLEQDSKHFPRRSFLLRLWRPYKTGNSNWQASLEDTRTNERVGFGNLEQLFAFLMVLIERDDKRNTESAPKNKTAATRQDCIVRVAEK